MGLLKAYLLEAKWFHSGHRPNMEEYMQNAYVSIAGPLVRAFAYVAGPDPVIVKELEYLKSNPDIVYWLCVIERLVNDLGTSTVSHLLYYYMIRVRKKNLLFIGF